MSHPTVFIIAGERSGDIHASKLMYHLKKLKPTVRFIGIGGKMMESQGLQSLVPLESFSVVGFWEVFKNITFFRKTLYECERLFKSNKIDLVILVDFPGFNIRIAEIAKKNSIPVCYYIAPQLWAWGKGRIYKLQKYVDLLLVVFPFEVEFFSPYIQNVEFVGHPLLDEPVFQMRIPSFYERDNSIAYLPGSRKSELKHHKSLTMNLIDVLQKQMPDYVVNIPLINTYDRIHLKEILDKPNVTFSNNSYDVLRTSKVGIIKSGTSNLEAALLGIPFVMFYKTSFLTYQLARSLVNIDKISIVNILLGKRLVPEFIQNKAHPKAILQSLKEIIENRSIYEEYQKNFNTVRELLGKSGASERAVKKIVDFFNI